MPKIELEGLDELEKKLKENIKMNDVKRVVVVNGAELQQKMQEKADFRGHYGYVPGKKGKQFIKPTGALKGSVMLEIKSQGLVAEVEPEKKYAPYVEYGTRFMEAQPFVRPAFEEQEKQFKKDMQKLVR